MIKNRTINILLLINKKKDYSPRAKVKVAMILKRIILNLYLKKLKFLTRKTYFPKKPNQIKDEIIKNHVTSKIRSSPI